MTRFVEFGWAPLLFSTAVTAVSAIAIFFLGMPPKMLVPISWATVFAYIGLKTMVEHRLRRR
jgi:hypothetical protein